MAVYTSKRLFSVSEFEQMDQAGIFREDDRLELIDGKIFAMAPIGSRHAACVRRLQRLFTQELGERVLVDVQNPIVLHDRSEPLPDVMLLQPRADLYASGHPRPSDVLLVVEVADTSLAYDQEIKIPAYARSEIPEVWIIDLTSASVHVYRLPSPAGYREVTSLQGGAMLAPQCFPALALPVARMLA
jgi:Uma2 family endonuclease